MLSNRRSTETGSAQHQAASTVGPEHLPRGAAVGRWAGLAFRRTLYAPSPDQAEHAALSLCMALRVGLASPVWLVARGTSMLPWRLTRWEMKVEPLDAEPEPGMILVFRQGAKLYYHRVLEPVAPDQWRTKGDTLLEQDEPVCASDIIGQVTAMRRGDRVRPVKIDGAGAWLSQRLGKSFNRLLPRTGRWQRLGLRSVYLATLLSAWPFRRCLRGACTGVLLKQLNNPTANPRE